MAYIGKSPTGTGIRQRYYFTATGGETSLSGIDDNNLSLSFTDGAYVDVSLNGVALVAGTDYNTNTANTISGLSALVADDVAEIIVYDVFTVADTVSAKNGGTFSGNVTFNDDVTIGNDLSITGNITRPVVTARKGSPQSISRGTWTKVTGFTTSEYDSHSAWDGSKFTVPSGQAGRYLVSCFLYLDFTSAGNDGEQARGAIYINGTLKAIFGGLSMANGGRHIYYHNSTGSLIYDLSVGDEVEFYAYMQDDSASGTLYVHGGADNGSQIGIARID